MQLELDAIDSEASEGLGDQEQIELLTEIPQDIPDLFPSKKFKPQKAIRVQPILSPDNYMEEIPAWLAMAKESIYIEQQYIRGSQPNIMKLLSSIREAVKHNSKLDVRIIVAQPMGSGARFKKEADAIRALAADFSLKLGKHVRILNPHLFTHCHNKLIVVDDSSVLISSQNWSDYAVMKNREAGLLIHEPKLAKFYSKIFKYDWETGLRDVTEERSEFFAMESLASGGLLRLNWGDYVEV